MTQPFKRYISEHTLEINLGVFRPSFLKGRFVKWLYLQGSNLPFSHESIMAIQTIFTALPVFHSARVQKALNFPRRNSIFLPCLELEYMPPIQGCWGSSEISVLKPTQIQGESHTSIKKEIPKPKSIWNREQVHIKHLSSTKTLPRKRAHKALQQNESAKKKNKTPLISPLKINSTSST